MEFKPYSEILEEYPNGKIPYSVLLHANEWKEKREEISQREKNVCQVCKSKCMDDLLFKISGNFVKPIAATYEEVEIEKEYKDVFGDVEFKYIDFSIELVEQVNPKIPHVHHTYYLRNNLPWEYPEKDLMLVCHDCHNEIHKTQIIKVYMNNKKFELCDFNPCQKCNGTGYLPEYNYWQSGICFRCLGACFEEWQ